MSAINTARLLFLLFCVNFLGSPSRGADFESELVGLVKLVVRNENVVPSDSLKDWVVTNRVLSFATIVDTLWHLFSEKEDLTQKKEGRYAGLGAEIDALLTDTKPDYFPNEWFDFLKIVPARDGIEVLVDYLNEIESREECSKTQITVEEWAYYAAVSGLVDLLKLAKLFGADLTHVNEKGQTLVHYAVAQGKFMALEYLAENGVVDKYANKKDNKGRAPLDILYKLSLRKRRAEDMKKAVEFLVAKGAKIHQKYFKKLRGYDQIKPYLEPAVIDDEQ